MATMNAMAYPVAVINWPMVSVNILVEIYYSLIIYFMDLNAIRFDFLFSYWIIIWFLIYYFLNSVGSPLCRFINPSLAIWLAFFENLFTFILLIVYGAGFSVLAKYLVMMTIMKGVPLYLLRNTRVHLWRDALVLLLVFGSYLVYLFLNGENLDHIYRRTFYFVRTNSDKTPGFGLLASFSRYFSHF